MTYSYRYGGELVIIPGDTTDVGAPALADHPYPLVIGTIPCSPAHRAGIKPGDVVEAIDDRDGRETPLFPGLRPPNTYVLSVRRGEDVLLLTLRTTKKPAETPDPGSAVQIDTSIGTAKSGS